MANFKGDFMEWLLSDIQGKPFSMDVKHENKDSKLQFYKFASPSMTNFRRHSMMEPRLNESLGPRSSNKKISDNIHSKVTSNEETANVALFNIVPSNHQHNQSLINTKKKTPPLKLDSLKTITNATSAQTARPSIKVAPINKKYSQYITIPCYTYRARNHTIDKRSGDSVVYDTSKGMTGYHLRQRPPANSCLRRSSPQKIATEYRRDSSNQLPKSKIKNSTNQKKMSITQSNVRSNERITTRPLTTTHAFRSLHSGISSDITPKNLAMSRRVSVTYPATYMRDLQFESDPLIHCQDKPNDMQHSTDNLPLATSDPLKQQTADYKNSVSSMQQPTRDKNLYRHSYFDFKIPCSNQSSLLISGKLHLTSDNTLGHLTHRAIPQNTCHQSVCITPACSKPTLTQLLPYIMIKPQVSQMALNNA